MVPHVISGCKIDFWNIKKKSQLNAILKYFLDSQLILRFKKFEYEEFDVYYVKHKPILKSTHSIRRIHTTSHRNK